MLLKRQTLDGIVDGTVTLAFRRWPRSRVRAGSRFTSAAGVVAVEQVERIRIADITSEDARRAGCASRDALIKDLKAFGRGSVYRIRLSWAGADPRVALRAQTTDLAHVFERLAKLDAASRRGPWTSRVLALIRERPGVRAAELAASAGLATLDFKRNVRKLKALGLTESLEVGYRLSPRGRAAISRGDRT